MKYLFFIIIFLAPGLVQASGPGTVGGQILVLNSSAESAALGNSMAGVYGNLSAGQFNPAALPGLSGISLELSHMLYFMDTFMTSFAYGQPIGPVAFGLGVKQFRSPDVERDYTGRKINDFSLTFTQYSFSMGVRVDPRQSLGAGVNIVLEDYPGKQAMATAWDIAWNYFPGDGNAYGLILRNLGKEMKVLEDSTQLPLETAFAAMHPLGNFRLSWEVFRSPECKVGGRGGLEFALGDSFRPRIGVRYEDRLMVSGGVGLSTGSWFLDFAFTPDFILGTPYLLSIGYGI
ncbi:MAG: hypothetical protein GX817_05000 [Elusimicrobia bacterium]|nr:hypothetical protein [Elusimicrobiota bacterium]